MIQDSEVNVINCLTPNFSREEVAKVLAVSTSIFYAPDDPDINNSSSPLDFNNPANSLNDWMQRMIDRKGEILYINSQETNDIVAFTFCYDNDNSEEIKTQHIWIAGCLTQFRRYGHMKKLFNLLVERANHEGYKRLTVNTYPSRFQSMPKFLESQKFILYSTIPAASTTNVSSHVIDEKWMYELLI